MGKQVGATIAARRERLSDSRWAVAKADVAALAAGVTELNKPFVFQGVALIAIWRNVSELFGVSGFSWAQ